MVSLDESFKPATLPRPKNKMNQEALRNVEFKEVNAVVMQKVLLTPETDEDHPDYSTAHADFTTGCHPCSGGCGFKAALDYRFEGYCCGKCWYHVNDPEAGKKRKHCKRCEKR